MLRRITLPLLLALALCAQFVGTASAIETVDPMPCKQARTSTGRVYVYFRVEAGTPSAYYTAYVNGAKAWTASSTPLWLLQDQSSYEMYSGVRYMQGNGNLGETYPECNDGYLIYSRNAINTWAEAQSAKGYWSANEKQQLCGHEMGHSLGLPHIRNDISTWTAIMLKYVPDGNLYYKPNWADEELARQTYPGGWS